jgi:hypothetical protein
MVFDTWEVLAKFLCVSFIHKGTIVHWWETPTISWKLLPFRVCCSLKQCFQHSKAFSNRACLKMAYIISIYIYISLSLPVFHCLIIISHDASLRPLWWSHVKTPPTRTCWFDGRICQGRKFAEDALSIFFSELEAMVHKYFDDLPIKMVFFFHSALAQIARGQISVPSNVPIATHQMPP